MIWMIVDRLSNSANFLSVRMTYLMEQFAILYIQEIVKLYGVPVSIVSDQDSRFLSNFWKSLQKLMGTLLYFSTIFYPN